MPAIIGSAKKFFRKYSFQVQIPGFLNTGFQDCSELKHDVAKIQYYEGGAIAPIQLPGRVTIPDVTLSRGATEDPDMYNWAAEVVDILKNGGLVDPKYKRVCDIVQVDRDSTTILARWRLFGAWPVTFTAGSWDNNADELVMEVLGLAVDAYTKIL